MYKEILEILNYFNDNIEALEEYVSSVSGSGTNYTKIIEKFFPTIFGLTYNYAQQIERNIVEMDKNNRSTTELLGNSFDIEKIITTKNEIYTFITKFADEIIVDENQRISKISIANKEYVLNSAKENEFIKEISQAIKREKHNELLLYNGAFMNLIVFFESMFSKIFKYLYRMYPEKIAGNTQYTYKEIYAYETLEDFKEYVIERNITDKMYGSYESWIKSLTNDEKISLKKIEKYSGKVKEIIARRNLIAHNDGRINSIYLNSVPEDCRKDFQKDDYLEVSKEYLLESIKTIQLVGNVIILCLWKQHDKEKQEYDYLTNVAFSMLQKEKWDIASAMYLTLIYQDNGKPEKNLTAENFIYGKLNYWQAEKWAGRYETVKEEIEKEDFSASQKIIQLASLALLDKETEFFLMLKNDKHFAEENSEYIQSWPIFKGMRKTISYRKYKVEAKKNIKLCRKTYELKKSFKTTKYIKYIKTAI